MSSLTVTLVLLALFALLEYVVLPALRSKLKIIRTTQAVPLLMMASVLQVIRSALLIAGITFAVVTAAVYCLLTFGSGATVEQTNRMIALVEKARNSLQWFSYYWSAGIVLALILALALYARRAAKRRMEKLFSEVYDREIAKLKQQIDAGAVPSLPPTADMEKILQEMHRIEQVAQTLQADTTIGEENKQAILKEAQKSHTLLKEMFLQADIHRRLDLTLDPEKAALPEPRTWGERIQAFFISRGLFGLLGWGSRAVYIGSIVLLAISCIGLAAPLTQGPLTQRVTELQQLSVSLQKQQIQNNLVSLDKEFEAALNEAPAAATVSAADRQVITQVAYRFEQELAAHWQKSIELPVREANFQARSTSVRNQVLRTAQEKAGPLLERQPTLSEIPHLAPEERVVLRAHEHLVNPKPVLTDTGKTLETQLLRVVERRPDLMERIKSQWTSFQKPMTQTDLSRRLVLETMSMTLGEVSPELQNLMAMPGVEQEAVRTALRTQAEAHSKLAAGELMKSGDLETALKRYTQGDTGRVTVLEAEQAQVRKYLRSVCDRMPSNATIIERLGQFPPCIDDLPEAKAQIEKAGNELKNISKKMNPKNPLMAAERLGEGLNQYRDLFPGQPGAEASTWRGRVLSELEHRPLTRPVDHPVPTPIGTTTPPGRTYRLPPSISPPSVKPTISPVVQSSFSRARSFVRLRGFARVGGVLIGRDLGEEEQQQAPLDLIDLYWELKDPEMIQLSVKYRDGRVIKMRPVPRALVYHALTYAADGRPLAVTMTTAAPLQELRILLHPTLIDSPLGDRVIDLDRFVDQFSGDLPARESSELRVQALDKLYQLTWVATLLALPEGEAAKRINAVRDKLPMSDQIKYAEYFTSLQKQADVFLRHAQQLQRDPKIRRQACRGLVDLDKILDTRFSVLSAKPEYYQVQLVKWMKEAADSQLSSLTPEARLLAALEQFETRIQGRVRLQLGSRSRPLVNSQDREYQAKLDALQELERWLRPPPEFKVWSGVREKSYRLNETEICLGDGAQPVMPFQFMLQVAFTSTPYLEAKKGKAEETLYYDKTPWEFPLIADELHDHVLKAVTNSPRSNTILKETGDFTVLQRLFRAAFQDRCGRSFPLEKLAELASLLAPARTTPHRTLRWNAVDPGGAGVAIGLRKGLESSQAAYRKLLTDSTDSAAVHKPVTQALALLLENEKSTKAYSDRLVLLEQEREKLNQSSSPDWEKKWDQLWQEWETAHVAWFKKWTETISTESLHLQAGDGYQPTGKNPEQLQALRSANYLLLEIDYWVKQRQYMNLWPDDKLQREQILKNTLPAR